VEGQDHPPPPLETTKASRGPAASSSQRRWSHRPLAAGWGQEEGYSWTWSDQRNNAGVPTETHPAFPTTGLSGKRALASGRRSSEFSQVSESTHTYLLSDENDRRGFYYGKAGVLARVDENLKGSVSIGRMSITVEKNSVYY